MAPKLRSDWLIPGGLFAPQVESEPVDAEKQDEYDEQVEKEKQAQAASDEAKTKDRKKLVAAARALLKRAANAVYDSYGVEEVD